MYYLKNVIVLPLETGQEKKAAQDSEAVRDPEETPHEGSTEEGGTLYLTDDGKTARRLLDEGRAVLVYLHAGNRQEDFGFCKYACEDPGELDMQYLERVYRRYRGIPWDILETARCLIRETTVEDVDDFYRIYKVPSITAYMEPLYVTLRRNGLTPGIISNRYMPFMILVSGLWWKRIPGRSLAVPASAFGRDTMFRSWALSSLKTGRERDWLRRSAEQFCNMVFGSWALSGYMHLYSRTIWHLCVCATSWGWRAWDR